VESAVERKLWEEVFRAEARIARLGSQLRDQAVGTDVAVTLVGRGNEAADTTKADRSVPN